MIPSPATLPYLEDRLRFAFAVFAPNVFTVTNHDQRSETAVPAGLDVSRYVRLYTRENTEGVSYVLRRRYGNMGPVKKGGHYYDTFHAFLLNARVKMPRPFSLFAREYPLAVCGFTSTDDGNLLISQLQSLPSKQNAWIEGHRHLHKRAHQALSAIRFERLLVHAAGDWARMCGMHQLLIKPAESNRYYREQQYTRPLLRLRYDGTARALRFRKPTNELPYWSRDLRSEWSFAPDWTPGQRS